MPRIAFYLSSHGFGHATREIEVINHLPDDIVVEIITAVPRWLFDHSIHRPFEYTNLSHDIGLIQIDSTTSDYEQTLHSWQRLLQDYPLTAETEGERLKQTGTNIVVGDISPMAVAAAKATGMQSIIIGNFSWDWIFQPLVRIDPEFQTVIDEIADYYRQCDLLLRTPLCGDLSVFPRIEDIPLIARRAKTSREKTRKQYGFSDEQTVVLLTFGGNQYPLPRKGFEEQGDITFITFDEGVKDIPNVKWVDPQTIYHPDIVNMCDGVITKLGYGVVTECIAHGVPLAYPPRENFPEHEVMERETARYIPITRFDEAALKQGDWGFVKSFQESFSRGETSEIPAFYGGEIAAKRLVEIIEQ